MKLFLSRVRVIINLNRKHYCTTVAPVQPLEAIKRPDGPADRIQMVVMGSGTSGGSTSLYLQTSKTRYMFNCGEGTQRIATEYRLKLTPVENIFVTSNRWELIGGLPGLALSMQDAGAPSIKLHGPRGLNDLFTSLNRMVVLDSVDVRMIPCIENKFYQDQAIKVEYVPIYPKLPDPDKSNRNNEDSNKHCDHEVNDTSSEITPIETNSDKYVLCFICRAHKKLGIIKFDRVMELGLPPGILTHLKNGRSVKLPDGKIITPSDVKSPDCEGAVFIIADCPTTDYIDAFVTNPAWTKYQKQNLEQGSEYLKPQIIVHFTPEKVLLDPRYVAWMESFESTTEHLLLNDSCRSLGGESVHRLQQKLHMIDNEIFPLLYTHYERTSPVSTTNSDNQSDGEINGESELDRDSDFTLSESDRERLMIPPQLQHIKVPIILGETMLRYKLRPQTGCDYSSIVRINPKRYEDAALAMENFQQCCTNYKNQLSEISHREFPQLLFTGTGSCVPNKTRNVSGMILQMTADTRMMLDCGEGTYNQLLQFYGPEKARRVLVELTAIYISHLHADHHMGLLSILLARQEAFQQLNVPFVPVTLIAPHPILHYLSAYNQSIQYIKKTYSLVSNVSLRSDYTGDYPIKDKEELFDSLGFKNIATLPVKHPANAYAIALEHKSGWKITYSGDTVPCENVVILGKDSDLCIHEATMDDELHKDASLKRHSTTSQAIEIGRIMNAKFILLTHFSQRYAKVPKIDSGLAPNVGIAYDHMLVRLTDLPRLSLMYPVFKCVFADDYENMEEKSLRRRYSEMRANAKMMS